MTDIPSTLLIAARAMSPWELAAVVLSIAYLLLVIRENVLCWPAALGGCAIYLVLMYQAGLYMESLLQVFYMAMAVYGWRNWRHPSGGHELRVKSWPLAFHLLPLTLILICSWATGAWLSANTEAAFPYLDSFTTWGAIITTWMVARKIIQNWHYWFVIDAVSIYLFLSRELYLTAVLFALYLVLVVVGYRGWRASMAAHP